VRKGIPHEALDYSKSTGYTYRIYECNQCVGTGNSKAVQITRKSNGFLWHCFRCKLSGFVDDTGASPFEVQQRLDIARMGQDKEDTRPEVVTLPDDYTTKLPPKALVQLYDLEIFEDDMEVHEIGWSPGHRRIIIPVYKYGEGPGGWAKKLVGVLGRKLDTDPEDKPKWWTVRQKDVKHPRFTALPKTILYPRQVVFVEDIFSAIKVSKAGYICQALLTTYLPYELYPVLQGWTAIIWLDADAYTKAVKYVGQLGANNITSRAIYTEQDPKTYNEEEITEAILHGRIKSRGT